jgi:hypothetical protein
MKIPIFNWYLFHFGLLPARNSDEVETPCTVHAEIWTTPLNFEPSSPQSTIIKFLPLRTFRTMELFLNMTWTKYSAFLNQKNLAAKQRQKRQYRDKAKFLRNKGYLLYNMILLISI